MPGAGVVARTASMAIDSMTLGEIAELLKGRLDGDPSLRITGIAPIEAAHEGAISFISNRKYISKIKTTSASAVLVDDAIAQLPRAEGVALVVLDDPYMAFARLLRHWTHEPREVTGVSPKAHVEESATVGDDVNVAPFAIVCAGAVLGDRVDVSFGAHIGPGATIGADSSIGPNAVIHHGVEIGARCNVYAGTVIGSDGFGFAPDLKQGLHLKIPQMGTVIIEDDVEIGANVTIDRASMGETRIRRGSKIDNLVQIGHSGEVGLGCFIAAQAGISGTTKVGNFVSLGGQVGIAGHVNVGDGVQAGAKSGIHNDIPAGQTVLGSPAKEVAKARRSMAIYHRLPKLRDRVRDLERRLRKLEGQD